jgi:hypothetical protein
MEIRTRVLGLLLVRGQHPAGVQNEPLTEAFIASKWHVRRNNAGKM